MVTIIAPVVTTTSIILSSNKSRIEIFWYRLTQVHLENSRYNEEKQRRNTATTVTVQMSSNFTAWISKTYGFHRSRMEIRRATSSSVELWRMMSMCGAALLHHRGHLYTRVQHEKTPPVHWSTFNWAFMWKQLSNYRRNKNNNNNDNFLLIFFPNPSGSLIPRA